VKDLELGHEVTGLANEFNAWDSIEARLSKDADQLGLILELEEQLRASS